MTVLNPTTWNWKWAAGCIITALIVIAIGHPLIHAAKGLLDVIDGLIPGGK
jgi:hypothetical protein